MVARRRPKVLVWSVRIALPVVMVLPFACDPPAAVPYDQPLKAPFAVSDYFSPTGYEGDGATVGVVNMVAAACPATDPPPTNIGDCYQVTYTPPVPAVYSYAAVVWQYPGNNWGGYPGHTIEPGATQATFYALGGKGGEQVQFKVGGIQGETFTDSISVAGPIESLTTKWTAYTVPFDGATYDQVLGGFAWVVNLSATDTQPIVFYLASIQWTP